jgi:uncharacterized membrane protein
MAVMRRASFVLLWVLSAGVVAYAVVMYGFRPLGSVVHPDMRMVFESHRVGIYSHIFGSALALAVGPLQLWTRLRNTHRSLHRWLGRIYLGAGVLVGGVAGLYMAFHAFSGLIARFGFACLAIAWLYTGARAYVAIRAGDVASHRAWMVRNFSLTFAAVTLRAYLPLATVAGVEFDVAYPAIAWLCWVPNLLAAELLFNKVHNQPMEPTGQRNRSAPLSPGR